MKNFLKKAIVKADIAAYNTLNKTVDKLEKIFDRFFQDFEKNLDATLDNIEMQFRLKNPMYYYFLLQAQKIIINRKLRDTKLLTNVLNDRKNKLVDSEIETRKPLAEQHQTAIKLRSNNDERSTNHCKAEIIRDDRN